MYINVKLCSDCKCIVCLLQLVVCKLMFLCIVYSSSPSSSSSVEVRACPWCTWLVWGWETLMSGKISSHDAGNQPSQLQLHHGPLPESPPPPAYLPAATRPLFVNLPNVYVFSSSQLGSQEQSGTLEQDGSHWPVQGVQESLRNQSVYVVSRSFFLECWARSMDPCQVWCLALD